MKEAGSLLDIVPDRTDLAALDVSLVGILRAQFDHIIKRHSYDQVIRIMEEKTAGHIGCAGYQ